MKAVVYTSVTGFTEKYASFLSAETGLPAYRLKDAGSLLCEGDPVLYMGPLRAGRVKGFKKAAKRYKIIAAVSVGFGIPNPATEKETRKRCKIDTVFCLQGGLYPKKLKGVDKFLIRGMTRSLAPALERTPARTPETDDLLALLRDGGDRVSFESLAPLISFIKSNAEQQTGR